MHCCSCMKQARTGSSGQSERSQAHSNALQGGSDVFGHVRQADVGLACPYLSSGCPDSITGFSRGENVQGAIQN